MIVKNSVSPCWLAPGEQVLAHAERMAGLLAQAAPGTELFFRADDLAVPGGNCRRMLELFRARRVPLHAAVTPAWLTPARWDVLRGWAGDDDLWCWHQHGWRHQNHQAEGKKGEFGTDRTSDELRADIEHGRDRLAAIMGDDFRPVFTPPWNRFDPRVGPILLDLGFTAVSRSEGAERKVPLPPGLPDAPVNVDLHTRREADPAQGLDHLAVEFERAVASGRAGLMLHHQRMNPAAFDWLDRLLAGVADMSAPVLLRLDRL